MTTNTNQKATWVREELLQLLSVSGVLAGLAITGLTAMVGSGFIMVYSVL